METITQNENQFQKSGEKYSAAEIWKQLRAELAEPIAGAYKIIIEFGGAEALREKMGLGHLERERRVAEIFSSRPDSGGEFVRAYKRLVAVSHPPGAIHLMDQFSAAISLRFASACGGLLQAALVSGKAKQLEALEVEKQFFATAGLPHQATPITAGVNAVVDKLNTLQKFFTTANHGIPIPSIHHGGELFLDEEAKWMADLARDQKLNP